MNSLEHTKNNKSFKRANLRKAKYYETKYNISFLSDVIMQDRRFGIKYKDIENMV